MELNSDLVVQGGAELNLSGDVKVLRLQSLPSGLTKDVSALIAQYGTINMKGVKVTSWNGTGPDTDLTVPSGGTRGRAFVRAVSFMDGSTPRQSRMNIVDSDLGFLGYNAAESYGVSYKARGCGSSTPAICNVLDVFGTQTGSTFHDNYIGTYTWGAKDMQFDHNKYTHNKYYGLDPHDDSDFLTITGNEFSGNGNHGLICSERCDHLTITGNTSSHNTSATAETHGIMLHQGVTETLVANNIGEQHHRRGIVVFDSDSRQDKIDQDREQHHPGQQVRAPVQRRHQGSGRRGQHRDRLPAVRRLHLQGQRRAELHGDERAPDGHHVHQQHLRRCGRRAVQDPGLGQVHLHRRVDQAGHPDKGPQVRARRWARVRPSHDAVRDHDVHLRGTSTVNLAGDQGHPRVGGEDRQGRLQQRDVRPGTTRVPHDAPPTAATRRLPRGAAGLRAVSAAPPSSRLTGFPPPADPHAKAPRRARGHTTASQGALCAWAPPQPTSHADGRLPFRQLTHDLRSGPYPSLRLDMDHDVKGVDAGQAT